MAKSFSTPNIARYAIAVAHLPAYRFIFPMHHFQKCFIDQYLPRGIHILAFRKFQLPKRGIVLAKFHPTHAHPLPVISRNPFSAQSVCKKITATSSIFHIRQKKSHYDWHRFPHPSQRIRPKHKPPGGNRIHVLFIGDVMALHSTSPNKPKIKEVPANCTNKSGRFQPFLPSVYRRKTCVTGMRAKSCPGNMPPIINKMTITESGAQMFSQEKRPARLTSSMSSTAHGN